MVGKLIVHVGRLRATDGEWLHEGDWEGSTCASSFPAACLLSPDLLVVVEEALTPQLVTIGGSMINVSLVLLHAHRSSARIVLPS